MMTVARTRYERIADRLSSDAQRNAEINVYLSADDVAEALDDKNYDPEDTSLGNLRQWIRQRRMIGLAPTVDDVLDWIEEYG